MEDRRRPGLCYSCDSEWTRGHVCAMPKLFLIEAVQKEDEEDGNPVAPAEEDLGEFFLEEFPEISLNAITETPIPKPCGSSKSSISTESLSSLTRGIPTILWILSWQPCWESNHNPRTQLLSK